MESIIVTIFTYFLLLSTILFTVMSGVGYKYFSNQLIFTKFKINLEYLFGFGIGVGIVLFFMVWVFLFFPNFICNWYFTFPLTFLMLSLYLFFSLPISQKALTDITGEVWRDSFNEKIVKLIQYKYRCCGWSNITDNGIYPCPISFDSCCLNVFENYIEPRFKEICISTIFILITLFASIVVLSIYARFTNTESLIEAVFLLNLLVED